MSLKSILAQKSYGFFIKGVDEKGIPCSIRMAGEWTNKRVARKEIRTILSLDGRKLRGELLEV